MKHSKLKSVGAVLAGIATIAVLSNGTDTILEHTGVFPPLNVQLEQGFTEPWMVWLALIYRLIFMVLGGYVTARLAPRSKTRHVLILGVIGVVVSIAGAAASWGIAPAWFSIALILLALPTVILGGALYTKNQEGSPYAKQPTHRRTVH